MVFSSSLTRISVKEVEDLLHAHPRVRQAAIVAMPDPLMGEKACAYVRLKPGADTLTFDEMTAYLEEKKIARQKLPERLELVSEFPMTAAGKIKNFLAPVVGQHRGVLAKVLQFPDVSGPPVSQELLLKSFGKGDSLPRFPANLAEKIFA